MYALAAIPIWLAKMGIMFGVMVSIREILTNALDWIMDKFEKLLYFDFSGLFSGSPSNNTKILNYDGASNSFKFFPSSGSPFFILWIVFLSVGILLFLLMLVYSIVKRLAMDSEEHAQSPIRKTITSMATGVVMIFFVPFIIFSSMTITSSLSKALFKNDLATTDKSSINEYNSRFASTISLVSSEIYNLGEKNVMEIRNNSHNALYSHTEDSGFSVNDKDTDAIFSPKGSATHLNPFKSTIGVMERLSYEFSFLAIRNSTIFDDQTKLLISEAQKEIKEYEKKYLESKKLKDTLDRVAYLAGSLSSKKDESKSQELSTLYSYVNTYRMDSIKLFDKLREVIAERTLIKISLRDYTPNKDFLTKINGLYKIQNNPTKDINIIGTLKNSVVTRSNLDDVQKLASFANIYSLLKVYIAPANLQNEKDWKRSFIFKEGKKLKFTTGSTMMDQLQNIQKLVEGYHAPGSKRNVSLRGLSYAWSSHERTTLSQVIDNISGAGHGVIMGIAFSIVGYGVMVAIYIIVFQLIKRLLERLVKLLYLWIAGMIIVPLSMKDGKESLRRWFGMVMTELVVLIGLGLGYQIWRLLTPILFKWIGDSPGIDTSAYSYPVFGVIAGEINGASPSSAGIAIFKVFISLGLLELAIKSSDWLKEAIGGSGSLVNLSMNTRGEAWKGGGKMKVHNISSKTINTTSDSWKSSSLAKGGFSRGAK